MSKSLIEQYMEVSNELDTKRLLQGDLPEAEEGEYTSQMNDIWWKMSDDDQAEVEKRIEARKNALPPAAPKSLGMVDVVVLHGESKMPRQPEEPRVGASRQEISEFIQARLGSALQQYFREPITPETVLTIKHQAIEILRQRVETGALPRSPDLTVGLRVKQDSVDKSRVTIIFPTKLAIFLEEGPLAFLPAFGSRHCSSCVFLAHYDKADLYFCPQPGVGVPTVIARMSTEPSDYQSGISVATALEATHPLAIAMRIAQDEGYIERPDDV
jgi:hypothetical protein